MRGAQTQGSPPAQPMRGGFVLALLPLLKGIKKKKIGGGG
jgi:hypothetical protein